MDPKRRALAMVAIFVGLLALHIFLLYRMVNAANWPLAGLLLLAIALFGWRIHHYGTLYAGAAAGRVAKEPAEERRQIRTMAPILAGLLVLHAWLIALTIALGEPLFTVLLLLAVVAFVARLVFYARRWSQIRDAK